MLVITDALQRRERGGRMNREEAKSKVMKIYGSLSEDMKQAIDVLVDAPKSEFEQMGEIGTLLAEATKDCVSRKAVLNILVKEEFKGDAMAEIEKLHYANPDLSEYSDKLYKLAYERGKAEGLNIPEGATNGDVINTLFPDVSLEYRIWHDNLYFKDTDWWHAPYKQEGKK